MSLDASKDTGIVDVHSIGPVILSVLVDRLLDLVHEALFLLLLLLLNSDIVLSSDLLWGVGAGHATHHDWETAWSAHDLERGAWRSDVHGWSWGGAPANGGGWGGDLGLGVDLGGETGVGIDHFCGCLCC